MLGADRGAAQYVAHNTTTGHQRCLAAHTSTVSRGRRHVTCLGVGEEVSEFKSEIRASTIHALEDKVSKGNYKKYLSRLVLKRVRGFTDREVTFDFPVTALVGPNGGGKTTILVGLTGVHADLFGWVHEQLIKTFNRFSQDSRNILRNNIR